MLRTRTEPPGFYAGIPTGLATRTVVDALCQLYAGYDVELHKRDGRHAEARGGQAALSQVMLKLGLTDVCRAQLTDLGV